MEASAVRERRRRGAHAHENGVRKRNGIVHGGLGNGKQNTEQWDEHPRAETTSPPGSEDETGGEAMSVLQEELRMKEEDIRRLEKENENLKVSENSQWQKRDTELQSMLREERVSRIKLEEEKRRLESELQEARTVSQPHAHQELDLHSLGSPDVKVGCNVIGEPLEWRDQHRRLLLEIAQLKEQLRTLQPKVGPEDENDKDLVASKLSQEGSETKDKMGILRASWEKEHCAPPPTANCTACEVHQDEIQSLKEIMALDVQALKQHQKKIEKLQERNRKHLELLKLKEEEIQRLQNKVNAIQKVRKEELGLLERQIQKCSALMERLSM